MISNAMIIRRIFFQLLTNSEFGAMVNYISNEPNNARHNIFLQNTLLMRDRERFK